MDLSGIVEYPIDIQISHDAREKWEITPPTPPPISDFFMAPFSWNLIYCIYRYR